MEPIKRDEGKYSSRNSEGVAESVCREGDHGDDDDQEGLRKQKTSNDDCVNIEIKGVDDHENLKVEKVCRICHFGSEASSGDSELITLGCYCKGELGSSHRQCAEAWFTLKGDRMCEICGKTARNVSNSAEDTSIFMMEWNEMRLVADTLDSTSRESSRRWKQSFCNFVLGCLILAFLLPWFFRGFNLF